VDEEKDIERQRVRERESLTHATELLSDAHLPCTLLFLIPFLSFFLPESSEVERHYIYPAM
jgi:hypothetical protein